MIEDGIISMVDFEERFLRVGFLWVLSSATSGKGGEW